MNDSVSTPAVSIVIATYNYAEVVPFAIRSVLAQTFTDFELLVIGDGCTDGTGDVVRSFADDRVQWINLERNAGHQFAPNNEGLRRARAPYVAYLGHDDLWLPRHLERLVPALDAGAAVAHTRIVLVDPDGLVRLRPHADVPYTREAWIAPSSIAHRRDVALDVGGWRAPHETGQLEPEVDFVARIGDATGREPVLVPCLTAVKVPAETRRNVYRRRPTHDQQRFETLIATSDDPEQAVSALVGRHRRPLRRAQSVLRRAYRRVRPAPGLPANMAERHEYRRRYRGLD